MKHLRTAILHTTPNLISADKHDLASDCTPDLTPDLTPDHTPKLTCHCAPVHTPRVS